MLKNISLITLITLIISTAIITTGCATITGSGSAQSVSVQTYKSDGSDLEGARCEMTNDEGAWFVVTPGSVVVQRSNKDLIVICKKPGIDIGSANVVSKTKGNMFGNILLGGGVGAIVDHNNGTAYDYPSPIKIFMGKTNQKIEDIAPTANTQKDK